jgi:hypothetical protein
MAPQKAITRPRRRGEFEPNMIDTLVGCASTRFSDLSIAAGDVLSIDLI